MFYGREQRNGGGEINEKERETASTEDKQEITKNIYETNDEREGSLSQSPSPVSLMTEPYNRLFSNSHWRPRVFVLKDAW